MRDMTAHTRTAGLARAAAVAATGLALVTGCSGGASPSAGPSSVTRSSSVEPTTPSVSVGPGTTAPGTRLPLRAQAIVRFRASRRHNSLIALRVNRVRTGRLKDLALFKLTPALRRSSIYYVHATVRNIGKGNLSGQKLVLYGQVSDTLVVPPNVLTLSFKPCNYRPLPAHFTHGKVASVCMVMMPARHRKITAVQWRPADGSGAISWLLK
jgi:hypothetical protein